ncbi:MAG: ChaN family lipoprotein [Rubrivivax sp.]|nr:ChaN family lipoprotein [Rubrivivax sp.]
MKKAARSSSRLAGPLVGLALASILLVLAGCAGAPAPATPAPPAAVPLRTDRPVLLLGEVHDNAAGHALRLRTFDAWLATGARPALVLEQFEPADQPVLDAATRRAAQATPGTPLPSGAEVVAAVLAARGAGAAAVGWHWPFYEPYIERALRDRLPLVAANVGREEAGRVMREGLAAAGFDPAVPEDLLAAHTQAIEASHCGQVDAALARRMALAQVARDQRMAGALAAHAQRGAVLLAGNEHVRNDRGVPRWLGPALRERVQSVGFVERPAPAGAFDQQSTVPPQPRPDPCAAMRRQPRRPWPRLRPVRRPPPARRSAAGPLGRRTC